MPRALDDIECNIMKATTLKVPTIKRLLSPRPGDDQEIASRLEAFLSFRRVLLVEFSSRASPSALVIAKLGS